MSSSTAAIATGQEIGDFHVLRYLTAGGMADLYLVRSPRVAEPVVLKRVQARYLQSDRVIAMFRDEAQIGSLLDHPNIVRVHEFGSADGHLHIAMEYIAGHDLVEVLRTCTARQMEFPRHLGIAICAQLARGLAYAHDLRDKDGRPLDIVHCDISPGNVMLSWRGTVKLVDFGVAQARIPLHCPERGVAGKYNYMAPEQIRGETIDRRADLFSLGVILYEITCGRRLFRGRPEEVMLRVLEAPIPPPRSLIPDYPAELEAVVMRALCRDPQERYATAEALRVDLVAVLARLRAAPSKHELSRFLRSLYKDTVDESGPPEVDPEDDVNETVELQTSQRSPHMRILDLLGDDLTKEADLSALSRYSEREEAMMTRMDNPLLLRDEPAPPLSRDPERTGLLVPPEARRRRHSGGFTTHLLGEGRTAPAHLAAPAPTQAVPHSSADPPAAGPMTMTPVAAELTADSGPLPIGESDPNVLLAPPQSGETELVALPGRRSRALRGLLLPIDDRPDDAPEPDDTPDGPGDDTGEYEDPGEHDHTMQVVGAQKRTAQALAHSLATRHRAKAVARPIARPAARSAKNPGLTPADKRLIAGACVLAAMLLLLAYLLAQQ